VAKAVATYPRCIVCNRWLSPIRTARCLSCERRARIAGGEVRRATKVYGYDRHIVGRIVVEQDAPRNDEAMRIIREHLGHLEHRPAGTGPRADVAACAGNSSAARADQPSDDLRRRPADDELRLAGRL